MQSCFSGASSDFVMQTCFFSARHGFAMLTISYHACLLCVMIGYFGFTFVLRYTYIHVYCYTILISSETITFDGIQVFGACQMVVATSNYLGHHADSFFVDGGVYSNGTYSLFVFQCSTAIRHICKYKYVYMDRGISQLGRSVRHARLRGQINIARMKL